MTKYDDMLILGQRMRQGYAGYGLRGLGDAMIDYQTDHARWLIEQAAYSSALANYNATVQQLKTAYALAVSHYGLDLARWKTEASAYNTALTNYQNAGRAQQMGYAANQAALAQQGIVIPAGYPGCVTQAQHDAWVSTCNQLNSVKGLGALPTGPECLLAQLSVCGPGAAPPPALRAQPLPPAAPTYPAPPPGLRPEPQPPPAPTSSTVPLPAPTPASSTLPNPPSVITPTYQSTVPLPAPAPASTKSAGLFSNGLLLVVLAGGGYALYRTFKKPKAA